MEVHESEIPATLGKKIWLTWVETLMDPASSALRSRLCSTEVDTRRTQVRHVCGDTCSEVRAADLELGSKVQAHAGEMGQSNEEERGDGV